jgi:hypothetical protein
MAITKLYKGPDVMDVPDFDVGYWQGQGWATSAPTAPAKPDKDLYIGETNWAKLQKEYTPYQLEQSTMRIASGKGYNDIYWDPNKNIADIPTQLSTSQIGTPTPTTTTTPTSTPTSTPTQEDEEINQVNTAPFVSMLDTTTKGTEKAIESILTPTPTESKIEPKVEDIEKDYEQYQQKPADFQAELDKYGFQPNVDELQKLMPQIAAVKAEYDNLALQVQNQPISSRIIGGTMDRLQRQKAVELGGLSAMAQAYQGNIDMAMNIAQKTVDIKYEAVDKVIESQMFQLSEIYNQLDRDEKRKADALNIALNERERLINDEKLQDQGIYEIMLLASQNGADNEVLQNIMKSENPKQAIINAGGFISQASINIPEKIGTDASGNDLYYNPETNRVETSQQLIGNVIGDKGIMSSSGNAYDMSTYATDPKHSQSVQRYLDEIGKFNNTSDIDNYIQSKYPNSSITGNIVSNVSSKYGIGWEELVALAQHESLLGTSNVAKSNNNPGGITWNANFPEDMKGTARPGSEGGYYVKFDSMEEGLASVAYELARRKVDISDAESGVFNTKDYDFVRQKINNNTGAADAAKTVVRDFSEALNLMSSDLFQYQNVASASQRALFKNFPGTTVYEINSLIESAKSNIGIDKLLEIKASGAGLGQVPQSQLETLQSVLGRMDVTRDPVLLRRDIEEAINKYNSVVDRTTNENNELMKQYPQYAEMLNLDVNTDTGEPDISDINLSF